MNTLYSYIPVSLHTACDIHQMSRKKKLPFSLSKNNARDLFDPIHVDILGPFSTSSIHGFKYFLTILDDYSRQVWEVVLKLKSEASCGRIEIRHQHIFNIRNAVMFQSKLPKKIWLYLVLHEVFLLNRIPAKILQNKASYEILYGTAPDLSQLSVFGCLSYVSILNTNRHKFDPRDRKCAFLGYKAGMKGYILVDVHSSEVIISRNVKFFNLEFPFHSTSLGPVPNTHYTESITTLFPKQHEDIDTEVNDTSSTNIVSDTDTVHNTKDSEILDASVSHKRIG